MKEFKVIETEHSYSNLATNTGHKTTKAYAIVVSTHLIAEPDAIYGVHLSKAEDMFIIASSVEEAASMLNAHIDRTIGRRNKEA